MADFADLEQGDAQPMKIASSGSLNGKTPAGTTTKASYVEQSQKAIRQGFIRKVRECTTTHTLWHPSRCGG